MTRLALLLLATLALLLARRSPAWRPLAASLAALACIDLARLWVAPLAATRAQPWWGLDVALVALWPVAIGVGLLRVESVGGSGEIARGVVSRGDVGGALVDETPGRKPQHECSEIVHPPILPRLALLAALALALGACRPWLPVLAYLGTLRALRWGLAGLWAEALLREPAEQRIRKGLARGKLFGEVLPERLESEAFQDAGTRDAAKKGIQLGDVGSDVGGVHGDSLPRAPRFCALVLAGCNVAGLLAGAWLVPPWEPPAWALAGPVTWAAYAVVGCVMGREAWRMRG